MCTNREILINQKFYRFPEFKSINKLIFYMKSKNFHIFRNSLKHKNINRKMSPTIHKLSQFNKKWLLKTILKYTSEENKGYIFPLRIETWFTSHEYLFYADFQSINTFLNNRKKMSEKEISILYIFIYFSQWIRYTYILFAYIIEYNAIKRGKANVLSKILSLFDFLFNISDHWECLHLFFSEICVKHWKTNVKRENQTKLFRSRIYRNILLILILIYEYLLTNSK